MNEWMDVSSKQILLGLLEDVLWGFLFSCIYP
jgi:hypothetical protein